MINFHQLEKEFPGKIKFGILMSSLTTLEIGGPAKAYLEVSSQEELERVLKFCLENNLHYLIIGGGSNLLVSDQGVESLVIQNKISGIDFKDPTLMVKSGTPLQTLVDFTISQGLSGANKLTGIPGTVGGAIYGNAGAYGQTISDHLENVLCFDGEKDVSLSKGECQFSYRDSNFKVNNLTILEAHFVFPKGDPKELKEESEEVLEKRLAKYKPGIKCPGSFFKNVLIENLSEKTKALIPKDRDYYGKIPAWFFLDEVGAKGAKRGNIQVASFHGNLFINKGEGKAEDFYNLAKDLALKVKEKFDLKLEPEVQLINLPPFF